MNEIPLAASCGVVTKSFDCLKARKMEFSENLIKKILAQAILITIGGYILECTNNIVIQELEFFLSQFLRNHRNKVRADLSGEVGGSQVKM